MMMMMVMMILTNLMEWRTEESALVQCLARTLIESTNNLEISPIPTKESCEK